MSDSDPSVADLLSRARALGPSRVRDVRALVSIWLASRAEADVATARRVLEEVIGPAGLKETLPPVYHEPARPTWRALDPEDPPIEFTIEVVANTEVPLDRERLRDLADIGKAMHEVEAGWEVARAAVQERLEAMRWDVGPPP